MGHSIGVFIERWFLYIHGCDHFGTSSNVLYREVVLIKGGLIREVVLLKGGLV